MCSVKSPTHWVLHWGKSDTETHTHTNTHDRTRQDGDKHHYLPIFPYTIWETEREKEFDWIAAAGNAHHRVRVLGHYRGYNRSLDGIRGNHATVQWLAEYWRKVIHVLERDKHAHAACISNVNIHQTRLFFFSTEIHKSAVPLKVKFQVVFTPIHKF